MGNRLPREFDLSRYVSQLEEIGLGSARDVEQARIDCAEIVRSGLARLDFYLRPPCGWRDAGAVSRRVRALVGEWNLEEEDIPRFSSRHFW